MSNKLMKKIFIALLAICGFLSLAYSHNIRQINPETIFLTEDSLKDYLAFKQELPEKHSLVIKRETTDKDSFYLELAKLEAMCTNECEIITAKKLHRHKNDSPIPQPTNELIQLESNDFVAALVLDDNDETQKKIIRFAEQTPYWNSDKTSFAGIPYTNYLLDKYSLAIQENLFPSMFILGLIISFLFIKNIRHALVAYLPCLFSAGFSLTYLKMFNGNMNMVTSIIPLIVFTVTLSLSFHLYFTLMELKTLKLAFKIKRAPIFLMMFTTYIGFLSLGWAKISVIREFGLVSSHLVVFATVFTFLWYFLWENFLTSLAEVKNKTTIPIGIFNHSLKHWFIASLGIVAILSIYLVPGHLDVITDATRYFPPEKKIREKILAVTHSVSAMPIMEMAIDLGGDLSNTDIKKMQKIESEILSFKLSRIYKIISNNSLVIKANREYSGNETLPENIEGYLLLRGQLPSSLQESYPVGHQYRMTLIGDPLDIKEYMQDLKSISDHLTNSGLKFQINGIHHHLMVSQNAMIDVLFSSFISSTLVIFLFSALFLKSLRLNLIFIFTSLLPVALTFGMMYFLKFSINIATVMTFSISLGLVGDSSFHIIYAKKVRFKNFAEYSRGVLAPVVGSGLLLSACFGIFTFNTFMPIRQFGGILAIIIFLGTLADLYVLPTLLYGTSEHQKAYEKD